MTKIDNGNLNTPKERKHENAANKPSPEITSIRSNAKLLPLLTLLSLASCELDKPFNTPQKDAGISAEPTILFERNSGEAQAAQVEKPAPKPRSPDVCEKLFLSIPNHPDPLQRNLGCAIAATWDMGMGRSVRATRKKIETWDQKRIDSYNKKLERKARRYAKAAFDYLEGLDDDPDDPSKNEDFDQMPIEKLREITLRNAKGIDIIAMNRFHEQHVPANTAAAIREQVEKLSQRVEELEAENAMMRAHEKIKEEPADSTETSTKTEAETRDETEESETPKIE